MDKAQILNSLQFYSNAYDPVQKMVELNFVDSIELINSIHTAITENHKFAHSVNHSVRYAYLLLLSSGKKSSKTADDLIRSVLYCQQNNPLKNNYGLWPYYSEEPIEKMPSPDFNQAAFILIALLEIYRQFKDKLDKTLYPLIEKACYAASTFIVNRNTGLQYSHVVTIECYVCILGGELFSKPEFVNYGVQKIEKFMHYVFSNGDFFEFNSPTISLLMATSLGGFIQNLKNERALDSAKQLNKFLWNSLARHYHFATRQLAGPFSRTYRDFLGDKEYAILNAATDGKVHVSASFDLVHSFNDYLVYNAYCPPRFYPFFTGEKNIEYSQRLISHGAAYPFFAFAQIATTYIRPKYSLGSFNRQELWTERRPLISHFGTSDNLYCMRVRCLLDDFDFSSAQLHCVQVKNSALGHICFSTNRGIRHMDYDEYKDGIAEISDLRIRFLITGDSSRLRIKQQENSISVGYEDLLLSFSFGFYRADGMSPYIELSKKDGTTSFDLVLYRGARKKFDFNRINCAICQFCLHISERGHTCLPVENELSDGYLISHQKNGDFDMEVKTPVKPQNWIYLMLYDEQKINGEKLENYARDTEESALQYEFIVNSSSQLPIASPDSSSPVDSILSKIEGLSSMNFEEIRFECKDILDIIRKNEISIDIAKRFAVRMLTNIFEVAKNYSIIFENMLKYEYSNIYINLSQNNSVDAVEKTINNTIDSLLVDYKLFCDNEKKKNFIESVTDIIKQNYQDPGLSLAYIAEKTGLSESHISKAFKKRTGISYLQYLTRIRMEHAKSLLDNGETNTSKISEKAGYENLSSFLRAFKKYTGTTVGSYIKNNNRGQAG